MSEQSNLEDNIRIMEQQAYNPSWREIPRYNKPFGRISRLIKRIIRKATKFYIEPFSEQQNRFNDAATKSVSDIKTEMTTLNSELITYKSEMTTLKSELEMAFSRISNMEDYANELKGVIASSNASATLSYSQSGEDLIIQYIFKYLGISIDSVRYLDLGANHAKELSNTYAFYRQGARGVLLEANPKLIPELNLYRSEDEIIPKCLVSNSEIKSIPFYILNGDGLSSFDKESVEDAISQNPDLKIESIEDVKTITIEEIINRYFPTAPTILNIDIEGAEEEILASINFENWRPLIIILETIPYHPYLVYDEKRVSIVDKLIEKDYTEYAFTGINSIMLDKKKLK